MSLQGEGDLETDKDTDRREEGHVTMEGELEPCS